MENREAFDINPRTDIMTAEDVARFLKKSPSWVYKNYQNLGGVKLGGSLLFPSKEDLYERLFGKGQRVALRFHPERREVHGSLVQDEERGQRGRSQKKGGLKELEAKRLDPNRHALLGVG